MNTEKKARRDPANKPGAQEGEFSHGANVVNQQALIGVPKPAAPVDAPAQADSGSSTSD